MELVENCNKDSGCRLTFAGILYALIAFCSDFHPNRFTDEANDFNEFTPLLSRLNPSQVSSVGCQFSTVRSGKCDFDFCGLTPNCSASTNATQLISRFPSL